MATIAELTMAIESLEAKVAKGHLDRLRESSRKVERQTERTENVSAKLERRFRGMVGAVGALVGGLSALGLAGRSIRVFGEIERLGVAFEALIQDEAKALTLMENLRDFASRTPFRFQGLAKTTQLLIALGFASDDAFEKTKLLAAQASKTGQGQIAMSRLALAIGQVAAKGKLAGGEVRQLTESLVPLPQLLAEKLGTTTGVIFKMIEEGAISSQLAIETIFDFIAVDGPRALKAASQTFLGLMSTLRDNVDFALADIGEAFVEELDIKDLLRDTIVAVREFGPEFAKQFRDLIVFLKEHKEILGFVVDLIEFMILRWVALKGVGILRFLFAWNAGSSGLVKTWRILNVVMRRNPIFFIATAFATAGAALVAFKVQTAELVMVLDELTEARNKVIAVEEKARRVDVPKAEVGEDISMTERIRLEKERTVAEFRDRLETLNTLFPLEQQALAKVKREDDTFLRGTQIRAAEARVAALRKEIIQISRYISAVDQQKEAQEEVAEAEVDRAKGVQKNIGAIKSLIEAFKEEARFAGLSSEEKKDLKLQNALLSLSSLVVAHGTDKEKQALKELAEAYGKIVKERDKNLDKMRAEERAADRLKKRDEELLRLQRELKIAGATVGATDRQRRITEARFGPAGKAGAEEQERIENIRDIDELLTGVLDSAKFAAEDAFAVILRGGEGLSDALRGIFAQLIVDLIVQAASKNLLGPLFAGLSAGAGSLFGGGKGPGSIKTGQGTFQRFAHGGILDQPTFGFTGGRPFTAVESGRPEVIMPLARDSSGNLGVAAAGGGGNSITVRGPLVELRTNDPAGFRRSASQFARQIGDKLIQLQGEKR